MDKNYYAKYNRNNKKRQHIISTKNKIPKNVDFTEVICYNIN